MARTGGVAQAAASTLSFTGWFAYFCLEILGQGFALQENSPSGIGGLPPSQGSPFYPFFKPLQAACNQQPALDF